MTERELLILTCNDLLHLRANIIAYHANGRLDTIKEIGVISDRIQRFYDMTTTEIFLEKAQME
jgi:hypothetical protein